MSVFNYLDYKLAIRDLVDSRKQLDKKWTYQRVAEVMGIQKSYLSQVLADRADLNADQLYLLIQELEIPSEDSEYLQLLLDYARSSVKKRKDDLKEKIDSIQRKKLVSESFLKVQSIAGDTTSTSDYYLDSYNQLIHICLSHKDFKADPLLMSTRLGLKKERLSEILLELQKIGIIETSGKEIKVLKKNLHLSKDSKLFKSWGVQMRQMALHRSLQLAPGESYNFSVIFSCTEKVKTKLQEKFFKFISEAQEDVGHSDPQHVYQMNFDLLRWL